MPVSKTILVCERAQEVMASPLWESLLIQEKPHLGPYIEENKKDPTAALMFAPYRRWIEAISIAAKEMPGKNHKALENNTLKRMSCYMSLASFAKDKGEVDRIWQVAIGIEKLPAQKRVGGVFLGPDHGFYEELARLETHLKDYA